MSRHKHTFSRNHTVLLKYAVVGTIGTVIDVGSLSLFIELAHIPVLIATAFSFLLAVVNNFLLNKYWTFENYSSNIRKQFIKFVIVSCIGLVLTEICMAVLVYGLGIWYLASKLLTSGLVLTWNFLANKFWTFRDRIFAVSLPQQHDCSVSVIIPAYNEERRIPATLTAVDRYFARRSLTYQIIVVDDGSSDGTAKVVDALKADIANLSVISYHPNRGKGFAIKTGVEASRGEYILFTDADNSTPIEEFEKISPLLRDHPVVIGSRYISGSRIVVTQPALRVCIGRLGNRLIRLFLLDGINDTQCGFKAFQHNAAKQLFSRMKVKRFGFDIELLSIARLLNIPIKEVPVNWYHAPESRIRPIKDAFKTFGELVYIKLNLWGGRYR